MNYWLETDTGEQFPLQGTCTIGRLPENTLAINDAEVSRRHAIIHAQGDGGYYMVDLGSRNGTILNGQRMRMPAQLKDNDRIQISTTVLVFRASEPENADGEEAMATIAAAHQTAKSGMCWMLVADICQFTKMSQTMPQDELAQMVGKWVLACKQSIEKTQGHINKYLGDGFLAYWPMDITQPESIAQTVNALRALQASTPMQFRIVLHHGQVRMDSSLAQGEDNLIGPQVNFVFRMEKVCGSLKQFCLLSESAAHQLQPYFELTAQGSHTLGGFTGEHPMYSC
ncbi:MAG: adenylate/guanylate cyclase domain-containing protein [Verrucomicrobia bacterium]|nr:adenylate/guanylate cyclase domain-containing protein [Verrucomicrobiota bacterium]NBU08267.1 adenylate/guanylate cyclase domain-containing protein [Pseudomonadota bacterium]NDA66178.1 adenylate/guanylate cyclase domain-containing protein [Verrucomicrobiota bacterium]NDB75243.1 adenylate/guanylate cyclase domain-containing protein [Verrucomicrobiota bacterium]NDD38331.1 adenylate/guanylate cyclase domain-containing protein [Verrucomicrobiota bacterium]